MSKRRIVALTEAQEGTLRYFAVFAMEDLGTGGLLQASDVRNWNSVNNQLRGRYTEQEVEAINKAKVRENGIRRIEGS
jgi:hypothetical protein